MNNKITESDMVINFINSNNEDEVKDLYKNLAIFDDFIDWLDDNATAINDFSVWLTSVFDAQSGLVNKEVKPEEQTDVDEKN